MLKPSDIDGRKIVKNHLFHNLDREVVAWSIVLYCQFRKGWEPFTLREYYEFKKEDYGTASSCSAESILIKDFDEEGYLDSKGEGEKKTFQPSFRFINLVSKFRIEENKLYRD